MTFKELTDEQQSAVRAIQKITNANPDFLSDKQKTDINSLANKLPDELQGWIGELLATRDFKV